MPAFPLRLLLLQIALSTLIGCGGAPLPPLATSPVAPAVPAALASLPGNWEMELDTSFGPVSQLLADIPGALSVNGSVVSGVFRLQQAFLSGPSCVSPTQDIQFTGTVDANNLLTLTSLPFSGNVATLQIQLPVNFANVAQGTAQITGGSCAVANAKLSAVYVPDATGTYAGTLALPQALGQPTVPSGSATIVVAQSGADADGRFPTTATVSFTLPTCTLSGTYTGFITGLNASLSMLTPSSPSTGLPALSLLSLDLVPAGLTRFATINVPSGIAGCPGGFYSGQVVKQ